MRKVLTLLALGSLLLRHYFWFQAFLYSWILLESYLQMQQEKRFLINELLRLNLLFALLIMVSGVLGYFLKTGGNAWFLYGNARTILMALAWIKYSLIFLSMLILGISLIRRKPRT